MLHEQHNIIPGKKQQELPFSPIINGFLLFFHPGLKGNGRQIPEHQRRGYPHRACLEASLEDSQKAAFIHSLLHALPQYVAKAQQRNARPGPGKILKRLVNIAEAENRAAAYQQHHDPPRHQFGSVQQDLHQRTDQSSDQKCFYIIQA